MYHCLSVSLSLSLSLSLIHTLRQTEVLLMCAAVPGGVLHTVVRLAKD